MSTDNQLPASWTECSLGDVVDYGSARKAEPDQIPPAAWILELEDIEKDTSKILQRFTFAERRSKSTKHSFDSGDVLYGKLRPYLNKVVFADQPGFCSTEIIPLKPPAQLDGKYLFYWLKHPRFLEYVTAVSHGMNMPRLGTEAGKQAPLVLAPLNEQRRIVAKLKTLLARSRRARDALDAIPALLERFRQSVLAAAFRGDLTRDWRERNLEVEPTSKLLERIRSERRRLWEKVELDQMRSKGKMPKDDRWKLKYVEPKDPSRTALPPIPDSWSWATLPELGELARGKSKHRPRNDPRLFGGLYPFIQTGEVARSRGQIKDAEQTLSEFGLAQSRLFPSGTVCITIAANIADSAVLAIPACFPDSVVGLIADPQLTSAEYVELFIRTAKADLAAFAPATAQKNINLEVLSEVAIPLPPPAERFVIEAKVAKVLATARTVEEQVVALSMRCDALDNRFLAAAFRGEIVSQDPTDEPASVLLNRIRAKRESDMTKVAKPSMRDR